jgi:hypothetical protein
MNRTLGSVLLAIVGALALFGLKYYFRAQQERQAMDAFAESKLSHNLQVPLDCPPLGRLNVTFDVEGVDDTDSTAMNMPHVMEQWSVIWPKVYSGILAASSDWKQEEKSKITEKVGIQVDLPNAVIKEDVDWQIEYNCADGYFLSAVTGYVVKETHLGG